MTTDFTLDITQEEIEQAIIQYFGYAKLNDSPFFADEVMMALQWISVQKRTKNKHTYFANAPLSNLIQDWASSRVHREAVSIAAKLLGLKGEYPNFNLGRGFVLPYRYRLLGLKKVMEHGNQAIRKSHRPDYRRFENEHGQILPISKYKSWQKKMEWA